MSSRFDEMRIFTGNGNPTLAQAIADRLGVPMGDMTVTKFVNENIFVRINESVREKDVFVVQSLAAPLSDRIRFWPLLFCQKPMVAVWPACTPEPANGRSPKL